MRISNTAVIFLIAGILGCINAQEIELDPMCEYRRDSWGRDTLTNGIFKIGDTDCDVNKIIIAIRDEELPTSLCDMLEDVEKCLMNTTNSVKTCVEGEHKDIDIQTKIATSIIGSYCKSIIPLAIITSDVTDAKCFVTNAQAAKKACLSVYHVERPATSIPSHLKVYDNDLMMPLLQYSYDRRGCSKIQKFERCVVKIIMESCENRRIVELVDSWYKYVNNIIPCDNLFKSAASPVEEMFGIEI